MLVGNLSQAQGALLELTVCEAACCGRVLEWNITSRKLPLFENKSVSC